MIEKIRHMLKKLAICPHPEEVRLHLPGRQRTLPDAYPGVRKETFPLDLNRPLSSIGKLSKHVKKQMFIKSKI